MELYRRVTKSVVPPLGGFLLSPFIKSCTPLLASNVLQCSRSFRRMRALVKLSIDWKSNLLASSWERNSSEFAVDCTSLKEIIVLIPRGLVLVSLSSVAAISVLQARDRVGLVSSTRRDCTYFSSKLGSVWHDVVLTHGLKIIWTMEDGWI